jgi:hypothetical protein
MEDNKNNDISDIPNQDLIDKLIDDEDVTRIVGEQFDNLSLIINFILRELEELLFFIYDEICEFMFDLKHDRIVRRNRRQFSNKSYNKNYFNQSTKHSEEPIDIDNFINEIMDQPIDHKSKNITKINLEKYTGEKPEYCHCNDEQCKCLEEFCEIDPNDIPVQYDSTKRDRKLVEKYNNIYSDTFSDSDQDSWSENSFNKDTEKCDKKNEEKWIDKECKMTSVNSCICDETTECSSDKSCNYCNSKDDKKDIKSCKNCYTCQKCVDDYCKSCSKCECFDDQKKDKMKSDICIDKTYSSCNKCGEKCDHKCSEDCEYDHFSSVITDIIDDYSSFN